MINNGGFFGRAASAHFARLASGYPLHHLRAFASLMRYGGSATIPLALAKNHNQLQK
jgi:hypothetical protein